MAGLQDVQHDHGQVDATQGVEVVEAISHAIPETRQVPAWSLVLRLLFALALIALGISFL
ncbi:MAG TPA: hypothetical protein VEY50_09690 [Lysobacter sp.]|nr:hypothetical protein [Lysobacter sp.]